MDFNWIHIAKLPPINGGSLYFLLSVRIDVVMIFSSIKSWAGLG